LEGDRHGPVLQGSATAAAYACRAAGCVRRCLGPAVERGGIRQGFGPLCAAVGRRFWSLAESAQNHCAATYAGAPRTLPGVPISSSTPPVRYSSESRAAV